VGPSLPGTELRPVSGLQARCDRSRPMRVHVCEGGSVGPSLPGTELRPVSGLQARCDRSRPMRVSMSMGAPTDRVSMGSGTREQAAQHRTTVGHLDGCRIGTRTRIVAMPFESVSVRTARERQQTGWTYVDVRSPEEFAQGHPEGSVNVPIFMMGAGG